MGILDWFCKDEYEVIDNSKEEKCEGAVCAYEFEHRLYKTKQEIENIKERRRIETARHQLSVLLQNSLRDNYMCGIEERYTRQASRSIVNSILNDPQHLYDTLKYYIEIKS